MTDDKDDSAEQPKTLKIEQYQMTPGEREAEWRATIKAAAMSGLSSNAMAVLITMKMVGNFKNTRVYTRNHAIMAELNKSTRALQNATKELLKAGVISVVHTTDVPMDKPSLGGNKATSYRIRRIYPAVGQEDEAGGYTSYCQRVLDGVLRRYQHDAPYQFRRWARFLTLANGNAIELTHDPRFLMVLKMEGIHGIRSDKLIEPPHPHPTLLWSIHGQIRQLEQLATFYSGNEFQIGMTADWSYLNQW